MFAGKQETVEPLDSARRIRQTLFPKAITARLAFFLEVGSGEVFPWGASVAVCPGRVGLGGISGLGGCCSGGVDGLTGMTRNSFRMPAVLVACGSLLSHLPARFLKNLFDVIS